MTYRIRYRDRRRPIMGICLLRLTADTAAKAAGLARQQLTARGIQPIIVGITPASIN